MMNTNYSEREQVIETINRLFFYTDFQEWNKLIEEVFAEEILMDMVSLGAEKAVQMTAQEVCESWEQGFKGLDAIHHQSGNHIVDLSGTEAFVKTYAIASHYKRSASKGNVREFVGNYDFHLVRQAKGWRIDGFKFSLKYMDGNLELK